MKPVTRADGEVRSVLAALGLSAGGFLVAELLTTPAYLLEPTIAEAPGDAARGPVVAFFVLNFLGFVVAGAAYIAVTGKGWEYVDLAVPDRTGWAYVLGGVVASIGFVLLVGFVVAILDLPTSPNQVVEFVGDDPTMVLILIVIVFLFNAPAEEFLFRNVVQKRLYPAFSRRAAVVLASAIFASVHLPVYALLAPSALAALVSLTIVFGGAVIFGALYARTGNLVVPIAAHAAFNAFQFGVLYVQLEYLDEGLEAALGLLAAL